MNTIGADTKSPCGMTPVGVVGALLMIGVRLMVGVLLMVWVMLMACVLGVIPLYLMTHYPQHDVSPKSRTLKGFVDHMPPPKRLEVDRSTGKTRYLWLGPQNANPHSSGPPCYVFDDHGNLTEWIPETGEGSELDKILRQDLLEVSLEDALKQVENP